MNKQIFSVRLPEEETIRADKFVSSLGLFTRSQITNRSVRVFDESGQELKMSFRLRAGMNVQIQWDNPPPSEIQPEPLAIDIVYEDDDVVAVNKERGMVVHPSAGHGSGTLVQGLLYRYPYFEDSFDGEKVRPGIVHRLDKDTSGIMICAKNTRALEFLAAQFRERTVKKTYLAIVRGTLSSREGTINQSIGRDPVNRKRFAVTSKNAKEALTNYSVLDESEEYSFLSIRIHTGRTHQIRVHFQSIGHPVLGDALYSKKDKRFPESELMLHSRKLELNIPSGERRRFKADLPEEFIKILETLKMDGALSG